MLCKQDKKRKFTISLTNFFAFLPIGSNTAWAELAVAHLKLSLDNKRSSPVRVVSNVGNSRTTPTTMLLQPNTKHTFEDILVRLLINDDVIAREIRIRFFDEESGRQLLLDEGENVELPLKLVGKNVYRIEREIRFIDQSELCYYFLPFYECFCFFILYNFIVILHADIVS